MSMASSDLVDLEKGATGLKEQEELSDSDVVELDPHKVFCINFVLGLSTLLFLLFVIGIVAYVGIVSNSWLQPLLTLLIYSPIVVPTLLLTYMFKETFIKVHATKRTNDSDLSTKLLASKK